MLKTTSFLGTALKNGNQKRNKLSQEAEFIITLQTQEFAIGKSHIFYLFFFINRNEYRVHVNESNIL